MSRHNPVGIIDETGVQIGSKYFTVEEANRSLVFVSRVVKDILALYCRSRMLEEQASVFDRVTEREQRLELKKQYNCLLKELSVLTNELKSVGCQLRDWQTGTVEWPTIHDGREIYLCWRMGDSLVEYWHEAYEHFAARRRITNDFESLLKK